MQAVITVLMYLIYQWFEPWSCKGGRNHVVDLDTFDRSFERIIPPEYVGIEKPLLVGTSCSPHPCIGTYVGRYHVVGNWHPFFCYIAAPSTPGSKCSSNSLHQWLWRAPCAPPWYLALAPRWWSKGACSRKMGRMHPPYLPWGCEFAFSNVSQ